MFWRSKNVHSVQGKPKNPAQNKRNGRRTRAEKVGRLKYIIQRIGRLEQKIDGIDLRTRTMMAGLREWMSFKSDYIEKIACQDEVDFDTNLPVKIHQNWATLAQGLRLNISLKFTARTCVNRGGEA